MKKRDIRVYSTRTMMMETKTKFLTNVRDGIA